MLHQLNPAGQGTGSNITKGVVLAGLLAGATALPFLTPSPAARAGDDRHGDFDREANADALLGTWIVQATIDPTSLPPAPGVPLDFTELDTFTAGGGYLASNNGPGAGDPAGQGNWVRTGHRQFEATQLRLGFDANNSFSDLNKIRSRLTLNQRGDEFDVISQVDIILADGTVLPFHPKATGHGKRVAVEPLN